MLQLNKFLKIGYHPIGIKSITDCYPIEQPDCYPIGITRLKPECTLLPPFFDSNRVPLLNPDKKKSGTNWLSSGLPYDTRLVPDLSSFD